MKTVPIETPPNWRLLEYHPLSEMIGFGVGADLDAMTAGLINDGYDEQEAIVLFEGKILDHRHLHKCCVDAEVEPVFREFVGPDAAAYVRKNLLRRHLTPAQRAMFAAGLLNYRPGRPAKSQKPPENKGKIMPSNDGVSGNGSLTREQVASAAGVGIATLDRACAIAKYGCPELQTAARKGQVSQVDATKIARSSFTDQRKCLEMVFARKTETLNDAFEILHPPKFCRECRALKKLGKPPMVNCLACVEVRAGTLKRKGTRGKTTNATPAVAKPKLVNWIKVNNAIAVLRGTLSNLCRVCGLAPDERDAMVDAVEQAIKELEKKSHEEAAA